MTTDNQIMAAVRDGDVRQLAVLFERHHKALFNFLMHMSGNQDLAEDLVQDVFFRMLRYRHTYDDGHPFTAWMYRIARNSRTDYLRKRREVGDITTMQEPVERRPRRR